MQQYLYGIQKTPYSIYFSFVIFYEIPGQETYIYSYMLYSLSLTLLLNQFSSIQLKAGVGLL